VRKFIKIRVKDYYLIWFLKYAPELTLLLPLLRTLDALHLVSALEVQAQEGLDYFVSSDANLCKIAQEEQLSVINPAP
jgi:hypothetical protein